MKGSITALEKTLNDILNQKKYSMDYFQREYMWRTEHVEQMIEDLIQEFKCNYNEQPIKQNYDIDKIEELISKYNNYFMGSIILYVEDGRTISIIDGQQRITSLTLLLIYLHRKINELNRDSECFNTLESLICSKNFSGNKKTFNINVEERKKCFEALFEYGRYEPKEDDDISIKNMAERYDEIGAHFEPDLGLNWFMAFSCWLINNVILVEIKATSEDKAYTIFESMNNRGLSLTNAEMLKGFILSKFNDKDNRKGFEKNWNKDMEKLYKENKYKKDQIDELFFQSWLRAQFADTASKNKDFEDIARFHNWFKNKYNDGKSFLFNAIVKDKGIENFMQKNYKFYFDKFFEIRNAEKSLKEGYEDIYYIYHSNRQHGIADSLRYPLLLASLDVEDTDEIVKIKLKIVAKYIDGYVVRKSVNFKNFGHESIKSSIYNVIKSIRNIPEDDLKNILCDKLKEVDKEYNLKKGIPTFKLHGQNKRFVTYFLCRLTTYIEESCECGNNFVKYFNNPDCEPFEIEHIWSNHFEWHKDEFEQENEFDEWRNRIGALVLLPKSINASFQDKTFEEKIKVYNGKNIPYITQSLSESFYRNNTKFNRFNTNFDPKFKSYDYFNMESINDRCKLYAEMADKIWSITLD